MNKFPMVDLQSQYKRIKSEIDTAMTEVVESTRFIGGPVVQRFSDNLAAYLGVAHVIPCANGTDALQIALMALGLEPGDEVITTPFTFVATAEVIALLGLKPIFVDVDPDTFNMNPDLIEAVITPKTKAIIPVHLFGQCCDMEKILTIAGMHDLYVIEDNAQAIGSTYRFSDGTVSQAGTMGHIGTTSFFPSKNLGCYGDGGALFVHDDNLAAIIRMIVNHGSSERYFHDVVGVNSRLDALQAAVLDVKLKYLDTYNETRQKAAAFYSSKLRDVPFLKVPKVAPFSSHVFHQYTLKVEEGRNEIMNYLAEQGIASAIYYPVPLHLQEAYKGEHYGFGSFPVAEELAHKVLSLPIHSEMNEEIQKHIVETFIQTPKPS